MGRLGGISVRICEHCGRAIHLCGGYHEIEVAGAADIDLWELELRAGGVGVHGYWGNSWCYAWDAAS